MNANKQGLYVNTHPFKVEIVGGVGGSTSDCDNLDNKVYVNSGTSEFAVWPIIESEI